MVEAKGNIGEWPNAIPSSVNLMALIREIVMSSENVYFSTHTKKRLELRDFKNGFVSREFNDRDIINGIKIGDIDGPIIPGKNAGEWKCRIVFPEPDLKTRRDIYVVTIVLEERVLFVKTVMLKTR